jgi:dimethylhistidine N-methyltransferase
MNAVPKQRDALDAFAADVVAGLSARPKTLPCKWFYDEVGSRLFERITELPEYYPTRVETRLLRALIPDLVERLGAVRVLIEPGSGASVKTRLLLDALPQLVEYRPIDIAESFVLDQAAALRTAYPSLLVRPIVADFADLPDVRAFDGANTLVFFPGSTIGNFAPDAARELLARLRHTAGRGARLLIGVDMTQNEAQLHAAYDDAAGVTALFNKNLLVRANHELDADFDVDAFAHHVVVNLGAHRVEMHLVSAKRQRVRLGRAVFEFEAGESIHTENSYKYGRAAFERIARDAGWRTTFALEDTEESAFAVLLLEDEHHANRT